jgi:hypothetical protein
LQRHGRTQGPKKEEEGSIKKGRERKGEEGLKERRIGKNELKEGEVSVTT